MKWLSRHKKNDAIRHIEGPVQKENPFLPKLRYIVEQILEMKGLTYRELRLLLVDTDTQPESMLDEEDMQIALSQLSEDLNFLMILTDRPEYFQRYVDTMYEETGLLVQILEKDYDGKLAINMALDFEQNGDYWKTFLSDSTIYIPIYKKRWEKAENLDICVPIGYNTVIVKGI